MLVVELAAKGTLETNYEFKALKLMGGEGGLMSDKAKEIVSEVQHGWAGQIVLPQIDGISKSINRTLRLNV